MIGVAVFHLERERTAGGVEAVDGIAGNERQLVDGVLRDEIPIDDVAENFVDAHAVLIDGEPLRRAEDRRRDEPTIVEVELELIAGLVAERDTGQAALQRVQQIRGFGVIEIGRRHGLDVGRHLVAVDRAGFRGCSGADERGRGRSRRRCRLRCRARRWYRRGPDDADFGERDRIWVRRRVRSLLCNCGARHHHDRNKRRPARAAKCRGRTDATTLHCPPHGRPAPQPGHQKILPRSGHPVMDHFRTIRP